MLKRLTEWDYFDPLYSNIEFKIIDGVKRYEIVGIEKYKK